MKQLKKILCIGFLLSAPFIKSDSCALSQVKTAFVPISQGSNLYTQYHEVSYKDENNDCKFDYDLSLTYRYMQTRNDKNISKMILNAQDGIIKFQGNDFGSPDNTYIIPRDADGALVATYFGLSPDANFTTKFVPRIQNNIMDLKLAVNAEKAWFQINAPLTYTKWFINKGGVPDINGSMGIRNLQDEGVAILTQGANGSAWNLNDVAATGSNDISIYNYLFTSIGFSTVEGVDFATSLNPIQSAKIGNLDIGVGSIKSLTIESSISNFNELSNKWQEVTAEPDDEAVITSSNVAAAPSLNSALNGYVFGDLKNRTYNLFKFGDKCQSKWGVADVNLQLGYDFYKEEDKHFGAYIKAVIPTGTKLDTCWLQKGNFAPIIGNGRHFELGAGINWHVDYSCCDDSTMNLYMDGYITHLFKASQMRSFDLDNQPMSRYALVKELIYDSSVNSGIPQDPEDQTSGDQYAYNGVLKSLGDINTACVDISVDIKGEAVLDFVYGRNNWEVGAGYSFAGQTKEKICKCKDAADTSKFYGYLGNAGLLSILFYKNTNVIPDFAYVCNANNTSGTTLYAKTNGQVCINAAGGAYSYGDQGIEEAKSDDIFALPVVNSTGLMNGQILHRVFAHIDYRLDDCRWNPRIGLLGSFGFSQDSYRTAEYWDLGARIGFDF